MDSLKPVMVIFSSRLPQRNSRPMLNDCISEILSPISNRYNKKALLDDKNDISRLFDSLKRESTNTAFSKDYIVNVLDVLLNVPQYYHTDNNMLSFVNIDQFFSIAIALYDVNCLYFGNNTNSYSSILSDLLKSINLYDGSVLFLFDKYVPFTYSTEIEAVKFDRIMNIDLSRLDVEWECVLKSQKVRHAKWRIRSHGSCKNLFQFKITSKTSLIRASDSKDRPLVGHIALESQGICPYSIFANQSTRDFGMLLLSKIKNVFIENEGKLRRRYQKGEGNWYECDSEYEFDKSDFHSTRFVYQCPHDLFNGEQLMDIIYRNNTSNDYDVKLNEMIKIEYPFSELHMSCDFKCNHVNFLALKHDGLYVEIRFLDHIIEIYSKVKKIKLDIPSLYQSRWYNVLSSHFKHITFMGEILNYNNVEYIVIFGAKLCHSPFSIVINLLDSLFSRLNTFSFFEQTNIVQQRTIKVSPTITIAEAGVIFHDLYKYWKNIFKSNIVLNDGLIGNNLFESCSIKYKTRHSIDLSYNSFSKLFSASGLNLFHYSVLPILGDYNIFEFEMFNIDGKDYCELTRHRNDVANGNTISAIYLIIRAYCFFRDNKLKSVFSINE